MIQRRRRRDAKGFTIIEVLIVLAIAGLILLIVFLAVPAIQRNGRNTQYKREAGLLVAAAKEQETNKNAIVTSSDNTTIVGLTKNNNITTLTIQAETGTTVPASGTFNSAVLRTGAKCNAANNETDPGSPRGIAILYNVENGSGGSAIVCSES